MRFVSFVHLGQESIGLFTPGGIADVGAVLRPGKILPGLGHLHNTMERG